MSLISTWVECVSSRKASKSPFVFPLRRGLRIEDRESVLAILAYKDKGLDAEVGEESAC